MTGTMITLLVVGGLIVLVVAFLWLTYNSLVTLKARVDESWSGIDVQLKRRSSLIPNLIETVKGYAAHEKEVFERVTEARSALLHAGGPAAKAAADNMLTDSLKSLFAVSEAYPELKANENFMSLQRDLSDTEDKIAYARQFYNSNVMNYNVKTRVFPNVLVAGAFGFKESEFYEALEADREEVQVSFDTPVAQTEK
jgi:LemA protein